MRIKTIRLKGYLGINNGLLRNEVTIDFSNARHKICLIKGATGSGKSTIMNALSPLPDDNSCFVPGEQAEKEVIYNNGLRIHIIHPVTNRGERATTKAYIYEYDTNLNPNGNVTSFKEIVFEKLELDSNFEALSKLSNMDRGLADKTPAVRKKYVANIIENVEVFNNIYKVLNKHSSTLKSMLNSIVAKMDSIGNEKDVVETITALKSLLKNYNSKKDEMVANIAAAEAIAKTLDPDGTILSRYNNFEERIALNKESQKTLYDDIVARVKSIYEFNDNSVFSNGIISIGQFIKNEIEQCNAEIAKLESSLEVSTFKVRDLIDRSDAENKDLANKMAKFKSLTEEGNYETLCTNLDKVNREIVQIEEFFNSIGMKDIGNISSAEYEAGLHIIEDIRDKLTNLHSMYDNDVINNVINELIYGTTLFDSNIVSATKHIEKMTDKANELTKSIAIYSSQIELFKTLQKRPSDCTIDDCPFIQSCVHIKEDPNARIESLNRELEQTQISINESRELIKYCNITKDCYLYLNAVLSKCEDNKFILNRLGMGQLADRKKVIHLMDDITGLYNVIPNDNSIRQNLQRAYMFDEYKRLVAERDKLETQRKVFESKHSIIDEISSDINAIKIKIANITADIEVLQSTINESRLKLDECKELLKQDEYISSLIDKMNDLKAEYTVMRQTQFEIGSNIDKIKESNATLYAAREALKEVEDSIKPIQNDLNRAEFNLQRLSEYKEELAVYKDHYDKTETVKMYTSPTKEGIQLLFMEMYMHKILTTANTLLSKVFGGQFMLQPFVINGDEFRIPCVGNRMMNDDISSMSNGQICMISMILNFSILFNSSSKYNILKLDEIDGGLDTETRTNFIMVLNDIIDILGCEQCFLISHNEEIQYSSCDMILLRTNSDNSDYGSANIIFDGH